ncbi:hypothetical protein ABT147_45430 [Streptomyces sp. NPDC001868]|uniref:hypothetical protein n=1 Tax=Streptomyces sp. NPDC001868 TaxID=3154401 RepID=UPI003321FBBF
MERAHAVCATPGVVRAAFGNVDLAAQLGVAHDDHEALAPARSRLVLASAAAGLVPPVDVRRTHGRNGPATLRTPRAAGPPRCQVPVDGSQGGCRGRRDALAGGPRPFPGPGGRFRATAPTSRFTERLPWGGRGVAAL